MAKTPQVQSMFAKLVEAVPIPETEGLMTRCSVIAERGVCAHCATVAQRHRLLKVVEALA